MEKEREHGPCTQGAHFLKVNYKVKVNFFHFEEQHVLVVWLFLLLNLDLIRLFLERDGGKKVWPDSDLTMKSVN